MARSCFFLAKGMADGSLGKEIQLKSISDEVVFCHPIVQEGASFYGTLKVPEDVAIHDTLCPKTGHRVRSKREQ